MSAKPDLWMPLYFGAYLTDTMHLTTEQHGAYFLLLMACWKRGGELPDDDAQLAGITKFTPAQWRKARLIIEPFWQVSRGVWTQKRLSRELAAARERSATAVENGKKGGRPRKADGNPDETQDETQKEPTGKAEENPAESSGPLPRPLSKPLPAPGPEPSPATHSRAAAIVAVVKRFCGDSGKTVRVASVDDEVLMWVKQGVTDDELRAACEVALSDREAKGDASAITPGFINVFVQKRRRPKRGAADTPGPSTFEWWDERNREGVFEKAKEVGVTVATRLTPDRDVVRDRLVTLARLCAALGDGAWFDQRNVTLMRLVNELREGEKVTPQ